MTCLPVSPSALAQTRPESAQVQIPTLTSAADQSSDSSAVYAANQQLESMRADLLTQSTHWTYITVTKLINAFREASKDNRS